MFFEFADRQNISAIQLHTSNSFKRGAEVFSNAKVYFSPTDSDTFPDRFVDFEYVADGLFDTSRWIKIPVSPQRVAKKVKVVLTFASDWLLVSEVQFESGTGRSSLQSFIVLVGKLCC